MLLSESVCCIEKVKQQIKQASGKTGETVIKKLDNLLNKNSEFKILTIISNILKGEKISREELPEDLTCDDLIHYKFAPISSVDVECSFSKYKHILSDRSEISIHSSNRIEKGVFLITSAISSTSTRHRIFDIIFVHLKLCIFTFLIISESFIISLRKRIKWLTIWNATKKLASFISAVFTFFSIGLFFGV